MPGWRGRVGLYLTGVAVTTVVAGTATAPFAIHHFNRVAAFGLAANMLAVPLTALWIMPWSVIAFMLMPLGLEGLALEPMGWGIARVLDVAGSVAAWPGAVNLVPAMPGWGVGLVAFGGVWLCLWRRPWRAWGTAGIVAGLLAVFLVRPPDILMDGQGKLLAVRTATGELALSSLRRARFARETWLGREGREEPAEPWPKAGFSADGRLSCDAQGCIYRAKGHTVALVSHPAALEDDCRVADLVVSAVPVRRRCPSATRVIDRFDLWREGAHAVWLDGGAIRVESANAGRGRRPWVVRPDPGRRGSH